MFRKSQHHLQASLFSDLDHLSKKARERLETSWAGVFRREFFSRLDESPFAVLYSDVPSRPPTAINVLVGLEALKSGFGWSDEEMYDAFLFDLQTRHAVGYDNLGEGDFDLRTVYNFRRRLCKHMRKTGQNLLERAFEQVTDEQVLAFELKTGSLRMDSSQIASNIRRMGRLQLLVEIVQRVHRMLSPEDQARYADDFAPYLKGTSGQYVYHLKGQDVEPHQQRIGELMHRLLIELAAAYATHETYQMLERVFHEQFNLDEDAHTSQQDDDDGEDCANAQPVVLPSQQPETDPEVNPSVRIKPDDEISPTRLRSPDDPEATYRKKAGKAYEGYVINVTETCDPSNDFQLILKMQSAPNVTEDTTLLKEALPELKDRTDVDTLYNDAGFCGPKVDELLGKLEITQVPSALRGRAPNPEHTTLADCDIQLDVDGIPIRLTCPHGYRAHVIPGRKEGRFIARWDEDACPECHFSSHHTGRKPNAKTCLRFSQTDLDRALRRQLMRAYRQGDRHLRAAVEATVGALKRPFNNDKVPVRGLIRLSQVMVGSAVMVNIRRIQRHLAEKRKEKHLLSPGQAHISPVQPSLLSSLSIWLQRRLQVIFFTRMMPVFGF
jgi:hypothetical protein